jgi:hypothetical protein
MRKSKNNYKKIIVFFLFTMTFGACDSKVETRTKKTEKQEKAIFVEPIITGDKYFEYDEIEFYNTDFQEDKIDELYDNQEKSFQDSLKMEVILGGTPKSILDLSFIDYLKKIGFKKSKINSNQFKAIDKIFTEKKHAEYYEFACIPIFRDVLIFKNKSKVVGIAKICFTCNNSVIVGTNANTEEFGMSGDYEKLSEILYEE